MAAWEWNGARWWKMDFHTHTPASADYGKGPDQATHREITPREWLLDFMAAEIDCVAVTDHNTGDWIDRLKEALDELGEEQPDGFRPLHLFPGVELSVQGNIHLLAILPRSRSSGDVASLLGAAGFPSLARGTTEAVTSRSLSDVLEAVHAAGGLAIPAHVDEACGLFRVMSGLTLKDALANGARKIAAIEVVDLASFAYPAVCDGLGLRWTKVIGSDSHHPTGSGSGKHPGSHYTWLKMGIPDLEGVRLALMDGDLSAARADGPEALDPNDHAPMIIESLEVTQARYIGRSEPFLVRFNPWLNAVAGGRGTGKSTLVEFLRIVLQRRKELPDSLGSEFDKYRQVYAARDDPGLLAEGAQIRVVYRKDGARFRLTWVASEPETTNIESYGDGGWQPSEGDVRERFPVRIYSQKQVFELASLPLGLLRVVDDSPEVDRRGWEEDWAKQETGYLSLRARIREIEANLAEESRLRGELEDVARRLAVFESSDHAAVLTEFRHRKRQMQAVKDWEEEWFDLSAQIEELSRTVAPSPLDVGRFDSEDPRDAELLRLSEEVVGQLRGLREELERIAERVSDVRKEWMNVRDGSGWSGVGREAIRAYEALEGRLQDENAGKPESYGDLVEQRGRIERRLVDLETRKAEAEVLREEARHRFRGLRELRQELTQRRVGFLDSILQSNPYVRIDVRPYGAKESAERELRQILQREGSTFERDIGVPGGEEGLLGVLYAQGDDAETLEEALETVKDKVRRVSQGSYEPGELGDQRFANHLKSLKPEALDRLDLWFPEDSLEVKYSSSRGDDEFRSIREGSPGQKTAALLAFLLSYGNEPLVLDQPEDDLDNRLIYELIVQQLRARKQQRQIIVVTHNSNIIVNGDAELVTVLVPRNGETHFDCCGSLQEEKVRRVICQVVEGGEDAFEERYRRIALSFR